MQWHSPTLHLISNLSLWKYYLFLSHVISTKNKDMDGTLPSWNHPYELPNIVFQKRMWIQNHMMNILKVDFDCFHHTPPKLFITKGKRKYQY